MGDFGMQAIHALLAQSYTRVMPADPNAKTEENEPVRVPAPARILPRGVVAVVAVIVFVLILLAVVAVAGGMALLRR